MTPLIQRNAGHGAPTYRADDRETGLWRSVPRLVGLAAASPSLRRAVPAWESSP
jgi:hypothetical protein